MQGTRIKRIRKYLDLTMEQFGKRIGVTKSTISNIENNNRNATEHMTKSICREFNVNYDWLVYGTGEMFQQLSEDTEIAELVSDVLENGKDNAFYEIILEIIRTYNELSPASQTVLKQASEKLIENLRKNHE